MRSRSLATRTPVALLIVYLAIASLLALWLWLRGGCDDAPESRYWVPKFVLGATAPEQTRLLGKLGGLPWGFPESRWPSCGECGEVLSHIAQLPHVAEIFDLGEPGNVLHLFHCEVDGACSTWDESTGASRWIILDRSALGEGLTQAPHGTAVLGEFWISGWEKGETPRAFLENIDSWYEQDRYFTLGESVFVRAHEIDTKSGGIPYWTGNGPSGFPDPPFEYLAQFGTFVHCAGEPPTPDEAGTTIRYNWANPDGSHLYVEPDESERRPARYLLQVERDGDGFYGDWANLGSDGTGYLYINREADPVEIVWFWNR